MGEYGDMAMESELYDYMDARDGVGIYDQENPNYCKHAHEAALSPIRYGTRKKTEYNWYKFKKIIHETEKATLFELESGIQQWIPKSVYIPLDKKLPNEVGIPDWFEMKKENK